MTDRKVNILLFGANYYGMMASAQRVRNLFEPITLRPNVVVNNIVINEKDIPLKEQVKDVGFKNLMYNIKNPLSIIQFLFRACLFCLKKKQKQAINIFYCYGNPSIENICFLFFVKCIGYKIAFDIVENENIILDSKNISKRMQFKHYSMRNLNTIIPKIGSICFVISSQLESYYKKVINNKIPVFLLPICVNIDQVQRYKDTNKKNQKIKMFYGGSFGHKDGIKYLLEGFSIACQNVNNLELLLTGRASKTDEKIVKDLINKSECRDKITYLGCLSTEDYFKTMANSDILCMVRVNSSFANAGFPFKLGEYLASENAIIATNVGDVSKYLVDNKNALLIRPESSSEIARAVFKLAESEELRINLAKDAKMTAINNFDMNIVSNYLFELLIAI